MISLLTFEQRKAELEHRLQREGDSSTYYEYKKELEDDIKSLQSMETLKENVRLIKEKRQLESEKRESEDAYDERRDNDANWSKFSKQIRG